MTATEGQTKLADERTIRPRRNLPGSRAVVGGLLVAASAVAMFAAMRGAGEAQRDHYVVAAHDLPTGSVLRPGDIALVNADLPPGVARTAFRTTTAVSGRVLLAPLAHGALVPVTALGHGGTPVVALAVDAADGLGGTLEPGDRVDAYVSYGGGAASTTRRILRRAEVVAAGKGDGTVGEAGQVQVTLAVADPATRIDLVNAAHAGKVTLARVTGATRETAAQVSAGDRYAERRP